jgi:hypothetical protein
MVSEASHHQGTGSWEWKGWLAHGLSDVQLRAFRQSLVRGNFFDFPRLTNNFVQIHLFSGQMDQQFLSF